jgi:hypothetical protein
MELRRRPAAASGEARDAVAGEAALLSTECELYLAGQMALRYPSSRDVPPWVRLNEAAHASLGQLESVAAPEPAPASGTGVTSWSDLRARLARLVVDAARGDAARARRLQLDALIPLETRVARGADFATPRALIAAVEAATERTVEA